MTRPSRSRSLLVAALAAALLGAPGASAQGPSARPAAERLFDEGRAALQRKDYDTACARLRASHELDPAPGTLLNIGLCEEGRGRIASAWEAFRRALEQLPPSDDRVPTAKERIRTLEPRLPRLVLTLAPSAPADTAVKEGAISFPQGTFGVGLPLDPGVHKLSVVASGHAARSYEVELREGRESRLAVEPGPAAAPAPVDGARPRPDAPIAEPSGPVTPPPQPTRGGVPAWAWISGATGLALIGVGAGFGFDALSANGDLKATCGGEITACPSSQRTPAEAITKHRNLSRNVFIGLGAAGLAATGAGVIGIALARSKAPAEPAATAFVGPAGVGIALRGSF